MMKIKMNRNRSTNIDTFLQSFFLRRMRKRERERELEKRQGKLGKKRNRSPFKGATRINVKRATFTFSRVAFPGWDSGNVFREKLQGWNDRFRGCHAALRPSIHRLYNPIYRTNSPPFLLTFPFSPFFVFFFSFLSFLSRAILRAS